ncbi:hypothetical protein HD554DRAFT_2035663 [Boletus coccyginus]|nr:hypothetical protein HD554DRAFT_2035663 [Boletus coccyginus]
MQHISGSDDSIPLSRPIATESGDANIGVSIAAIAIISVIEIQVFRMEMIWRFEFTTTERSEVVFDAVSVSVAVREDDVNRYSALSLDVLISRSMQRVFSLDNGGSTLNLQRQSGPGYDSNHNSTRVEPNDASERILFSPWCASPVCGKAAHCNVRWQSCGATAEKYDLGDCGTTPTVFDLPQKRSQRAVEPAKMGAQSFEGIGYPELEVPGVWREVERVNVGADLVTSGSETSGVTLNHWACKLELGRLLGPWICALCKFTLG